MRQKHHETDDTTLEHLMNVAGVHPLDGEWCIRWTERQRESVARWAAFTVVGDVKEAGPMPALLLRCPFAEKVRRMGVNLA